MKKKLILKIGTSTLTLGTNRISYAKIEDIAKQIVILKNKYDIVLVSSGAIATARQFIEINGYNKKADSKQALAAIGQPKLMRMYDEIFSSFGLKVAQCLLTHRDFKDKDSKINTKNTINKLLEYGYTPIINENDTAGVEEIILGDNDELSAFLASIISTDLLVIASDVDGLCDKNPHINKDAKLIKEIKDIKKVKTFIKEKKSSLGRGGMTSKIHAAQICQKAGVEMWIVNGSKESFLVNAIEAKMAFTKFKS